MFCVVLMSMVELIFGTLNADQMLQDANDVGDWWYNLSNAYSVEVKRAMAGRIVSNLLDAMDAVVQPASATPSPPTPDTLPPLKFLHYSAHDTTVAPLLALLDAYDGKWPPYAAHVGMGQHAFFCFCLTGSVHPSTPAESSHHQSSILFSHFIAPLLMYVV